MTAISSQESAIQQLTHACCALANAQGSPQDRSTQATGLMQQAIHLLGNKSTTQLSPTTLTALLRALDLVARSQLGDSGVRAQFEAALLQFRKTAHVTRSVSLGTDAYTTTSPGTLAVSYAASAGPARSDDRTTGETTLSGARRDMEVASLLTDVITHQEAASKKASTAVTENFTARLREILFDAQEDSSANIITRHAALLQIVDDINEAMHAASNSPSVLGASQGAYLITLCNDALREWSVMVLAAQHRPELYDRLQSRGRCALLKLCALGPMDPAKTSETQRLAFLDEIQRVSEHYDVGGADSVLEGVARGEPEWVRFLLGRDGLWDQYAKDLLRATHPHDDNAAEMAVAQYDVFIAKRTVKQFIHAKGGREGLVGAHPESNFAALRFDAQTVSALVHHLGPDAASDVDILVGNAILLETAVEHNDLLLHDEKTRKAAQERLARVLGDRPIAAVQRYAQQGFSSMASVHAASNTIERVCKHFASTPSLVDALHRAVSQQMSVCASDLLIRIAQNETHTRGVAALGVDQLSRVVVESLQKPLTKANDNIQKKLSVTRPIADRLAINQARLLDIEGNLKRLKSDLARGIYRDIRDKRSGLEANRLVLKLCTLHDQMENETDPDIKADLLRKIEAIQVNLSDFSVTTGARKLSTRLINFLTPGEKKKSLEKLLGYRDQAGINVTFLLTKAEHDALTREASTLQREVTRDRDAMLKIVGDNGRALSVAFMSVILDALVNPAKRDVATAIAAMCTHKGNEFEHFSVVHAALMQAVSPVFASCPDEVTVLANAFIADLVNSGLEGSIRKWDKKVAVADDIAKLNKMVGDVRAAKEHVQLNDYLRTLEIREHVQAMFDGLNNKCKFSVRLGSKVEVERPVPIDPAGVMRGKINLSMFLEDSVNILRDDREVPPYRVVLKGSHGGSIAGGISGILRSVEVSAKCAAGSVNGIAVAFNSKEECQRFVDGLFTNELPTDALYRVDVLENASGKWVRFDAKCLAGLKLNIPIPLTPIANISEQFHSIVDKAKSKAVVGAGVSASFAYAHTSDWLTFANANHTRVERTSTNVVSVDINAQFWASPYATKNVGFADLSDRAKSSLQEGFNLTYDTKESFVYEHGFLAAGSKIERSVHLDKVEVAGLAIASLLPDSMEDTFGDSISSTGLFGMQSRAMEGDVAMVTYQLTADAAMRVNLALAKGEAHRREAEEILKDVHHSYMPVSLSLYRDTGADRPTNVGVMGVSYQTTSAGDHRRLVDEITL